jgi:2-polyprenyl-6-methoxyphenol hydroxylase-like FAD-dependent oxidoreductase
MSTSVLVVGAGPVGLTMASELARYGVPVRIVDKAPERTDKSKAIVLWSRSLEMLDRGGGAAPFIDAGFKMTHVNFIARDDKIVGRVGMDGVQSPHAYALMLPQSETERLLEERLADLGIKVERRTDLMSFTRHEHGVEARLRRADGSEEKLSAAWLIGCDGAHSTVRHAMGATFAGETVDSDWMLADVHLRGYPYPDEEAAIFWRREGVFVIFPIKPGRYRLLADLPESSKEHPPAPTLERIQAVIDERGLKGLVAFDPIWLAAFKINGRKVESYRAGRVFLCGDAAHVHSPAGGQGMNTGMQDAFNLAWKLASVINGSCGEKLLDSYSPERSKIGDEVLKTAGRLTAVATLKNPVVHRVRNLAGHVLLGLSPVRHALADKMTEVAIGYPGSPLNGPALSKGEVPKPGERVAPIAGRTPVGAGGKPLFALFADRTDAIANLLERHAGLVDPEIRPAFRKGGIWLVRPDGYLACSAEDAGVVAGYLDGIVAG